MTKKKTRLIVMNILFWLGLLLCFCAMGRLDYLDEQHITYGARELWIALVRGAVGLGLMIAGALVGRELEFEDEESEADEDDGRDL